jgi:hypothetical protein
MFYYPRIYLIQLQLKQTLVSHLLVVKTPNAVKLMVKQCVLAYQDTLELLLLVDLNASQAMSVLKMKLVAIKNAEILVQAPAASMRSARSLTTTLSVAVHQDTMVILSFAAKLKSFNSLRPRIHANHLLVAPMRYAESSEIRHLALAYLR